MYVGYHFYENLIIKKSQNLQWITSPTGIEGEKGVSMSMNLQVTIP